MLCVPKQEKKIYIGMRQQCASSVTPESYDRHAIRRDSFLCDQLLVAENDDLIDEKRASVSDGGAIAGSLELPPQALQAEFVPLPQFDSRQNDRHKPTRLCSESSARL